MLIIDCHAHVYSTDDRKYPPVAKPLRPPQGTGTVPHLRRQVASQLAHGTIRLF